MKIDLQDARRPPFITKHEEADLETDSKAPERDRRSKEGSKGSRRLEARSRTEHGLALRVSPEPGLIDGPKWRRDEESPGAQHAVCHTE